MIITSVESPMENNVRVAFSPALDFVKIQIHERAADFGDAGYAASAMEPIHRHEDVWLPKDGFRCLRQTLYPDRALAPPIAGFRAEHHIAG